MLDSSGNGLVQGFPLYYSKDGIMSNIMCLDQTSSNKHIIEAVRLFSSDKSADEYDGFSIDPKFLMNTNQFFDHLAKSLKKKATYTSVE